MNFLVLGAGKQGRAAAYDLLRHGAGRVVLADRVLDSLPGYLEPHVGGRLELREVDAREPGGIRRAMDAVDACLCAFPYYFNLAMTELAVEAGVHFCDLGGNTGIVREQLALDDEARKRGITVIPDCGLAPGMVNILAVDGIRALDETDAVRIRVGGLPRHPKPPLNYHIVYSLEGVLDYYTTDVLVLRDGEPRTVEALTGLEPVDFPEPVGELEAFFTAGGVSTLPFEYEGEIREMDYKTLRYPGHASIMKAIRELGLLETDPVEVHGSSVAPRDLFIACAEPRLRAPDAEDLVAMRVEVSGTRDGEPAGVTYELLDHHDGETGITAMERCTGYSLAITALLQAGGRIDGTGARSAGQFVPAAAYVEALDRRGIRIERTEV